MERNCKGLLSIGAVFLRPEQPFTRNGAVSVRFIATTG